MNPTTGAAGEVRLPRDLRKILDRWLAEIDTIKLSCRVLGHYWAADFSPGETYSLAREGVYALTHPCQRDLTGCGVKRTRHIARRNGWLARASVYDYSGARGYLIPSALRHWSGSKATRGLERLELKRRADAGEMDAVQFLEEVSS